MKWLWKALSALARPLGISSPEDVRNRTNSEINKKATRLIVISDRSPQTKSPKNPTR